MASVWLGWSWKAIVGICSTLWQNGQSSFSCLDGGDCWTRRDKASSWHSAWLDARVPMDTALSLDLLAWRKNQKVKGDLLHMNRTRGLYMGNESAQQIAKFVQLNWDLVSEVQLVHQEDKTICMQIMDNWCHIYCKIGVPSTIQRARPRIQFQFHLEGRCRGEHKFFACLLISTCKNFDTRQSLEKELSMQPSLHVAWSTSRDSPSSLRPLLFCLGSMIDS